MSPELKTAIFKGIGLWPTSQLIRWSPKKGHFFNLETVEVFRCQTDGGVVLADARQSSLGRHEGHKVKAPSFFSLWEFLKLQARLIK